MQERALDILLGAHHFNIRDIIFLAGSNNQNMKMNITPYA